MFEKQQLNLKALGEWCGAEVGVMGEQPGTLGLSLLPTTLQCLQSLSYFYCDLSLLISYLQQKVNKIIFQPNKI